MLVSFLFASQNLVGEALGKHPKKRALGGLGGSFDQRSRLLSPRELPSCWRQHAIRLRVGLGCRFTGDLKTEFRALPIDFSLLASIGEKIVLLFAGGLVGRFFERSARLIVFYGHVGAFRMQVRASRPAWSIRIRW
jgi:hypothetical protein